MERELWAQILLKFLYFKVLGYLDIEKQAEAMAMHASACFLYFYFDPCYFFNPYFALTDLNHSFTSCVI